MFTPTILLEFDDFEASIYDGNLFMMATQNMLRTHEGKLDFLPIKKNEKYEREKSIFFPEVLWELRFGIALKMVNSMEKRRGDFKHGTYTRWQLRTCCARMKVKCFFSAKRKVIFVPAFDIIKCLKQV